MVLVDSKHNNQEQPVSIQLYQSIVVFLTLSLPLSPILLSVLAYFYPILLVLIIPYLLHLFNDKSYRTQLHPNQAVQKWKLWKYYNEYFNSELICKQKLDNTNNYLFGYHPHGILPFGITASLTSNIDGVIEKLGDISLKFVTLQTNFYIPFHSELFKWLNFTDSSKSTLNNFFEANDEEDGKNNKRGKGLVIAVGGAKESILAVPDNFQLVLKNRKGFVKIALKNRANLVPVLGLGENELYNQYVPPKGTLLEYVQTNFKKTFGFYMLLIRGIGIIKNTFGFLPGHGPLTVIVGEPIEISKEDVEISEEVVDKYHKLYLDQVQRLYDEFKKYHQQRVLRLTGKDVKIPELEFV